jgi:hypothetical protein
MNIDHDSLVEWAEKRFEDIVVSGNEVKVNDPWWVNDEGLPDSDHKCWLNTDKGCFHAFKSRKTGNVVAFVMEFENCDWDEAREIVGGEDSLEILEKKLDDFLKKEEAKVEQQPKKTLTLPSKTVLIESFPDKPICRLAAKYLKERNLPSDNLMVCLEGDYRNRIVIPYYDKTGKLIYWNTRALFDDGSLRYWGPKKEEFDVGKCLGENTPVLMHNGDVKLVQHITEADLLMGPDSQPRKVSKVIKGHGRLYRVIPNKGEPYIVNENHVLALYYTRPGNKRNVCLTVKDYLSKTKTYKSWLKGYKVAVDFPYSEVPINPYIFGLWLGDGSSNWAALTNTDEPLIKFWYAETARRGLRIHIDGNDSKGCPTYYTYGEKGTRTTNSLLADLDSLNVRQNKHIPKCYLRNTRKIRLSVLAGYLDTDGSLSNNCYDFIAKQEQVAKDITYLARSLGFACYYKETTKRSQTGFVGTYYRGTISGCVDEIPLILEHKKAKPRRSRKNILRSGVTVEPIGEGDYYGFSVDQDHLFLLGDFTVTHNSDVLWLADWPEPGIKLYLTEGEFDAMSLVICGFHAGACGGKALCDKQIAMLAPYRIVLALDADKAGNDIYEIAQSLLEKGGLLMDGKPRISMVRPPVQCKDWNKFLVDYGEATVKAWIAKYERACTDDTLTKMKFGAL